MKFVKVLIFIGLILAVVWAGKGIFKYNVFSTHDGDHHFARSFDAVKTITEGHFPLRWAGSLNYGCGVPIYNFFYPLIYYLVILLNFLTHDIFLALKLIAFNRNSFFLFVDEKRNPPSRRAGKFRTSRDWLCTFISLCSLSILAHFRSRKSGVFSLRYFTGGALFVCQADGVRRKKNGFLRLCNGHSRRTFDHFS